MSDVMLHGVLNMPPELWGNDELDKNQRYSRYKEASKTIYSLQQRNEELVKENHDMETLLIGCILSGAVDKFTPEKLRGTVSDTINDLQSRIAKMVDVAKKARINMADGDYSLKDLNQIITIGEGE